MPFLADLVSLVDPTSRWSFLNYIRSQERLFPFTSRSASTSRAPSTTPHCRWVSERLPSCRFGHRADTVHWDESRQAFEVAYTRLDGDGAPAAAARSSPATSPWASAPPPRARAPLRPLAGDPDVPVLHSADYLAHRERLLAAEHVTVVGAGQSGAEVLLDLLRARPRGREGLAWLARTPRSRPWSTASWAWSTSPPTTRATSTRCRRTHGTGCCPGSGSSTRDVSADTLADIHDELYRRVLPGGWPDVVLTPGVAVTGAARRDGRIDLALRHTEEGSAASLRTDAVVLATGYAERPVDALLEPLGEYVSATRRAARWSTGTSGSPSTRRSAARCSCRTPSGTRTAWAPRTSGSPPRSAVILNALTGRSPYPLPSRTAFTTFGLADTRR